MAISVTNSQGTKVYIADSGTAVTDATAIATAISGGDQIGCIQSLGSISTSRSVQEYSCLSEDSTVKSSGSMSLGNIAIELLFDALDAAGQATLRSAYTANSSHVFIVELNDDAGANPTYITFDGFVSSEEVSAQKDNAVMYNVTVELNSVPAFVLASA